jgi:hypothetical protein
MVGRGVDRALAVEVGRQLVNEAAEEAEDVGQEPDVVQACVLDRLTVLARLEQGQLIRVSLEQMLREELGLRQQEAIETIATGLEAGLFGASATPTTHPSNHAQPGGQ